MISDFNAVFKYAVSVRDKTIEGRPPRQRAAQDAVAMSLILTEARRVSITDVERSRELLALSSFLASTRLLRALNQGAREEPALALKCSACGSDQDACAGTCYDCRDQNDKSPTGPGLDACITCGSCPDCSSVEWVRPQPDEILRSGQWEKKGRRS